jgi:hypothetical protein
MLDVNELMLSPVGIVFEPCEVAEVVVVDELLDDEHPARTKAPTATAPSKLIRRTPGDDRSLFVLCFNSMPDPFRLCPPPTDALGRGRCR